MLFLFFHDGMQKMLQPLFPVTRATTKADTKRICRGRTGEACIACQKRCMYAEINADERAIADAKVTESEYYDSPDDHASDAESESSGSSDDDASGTKSASSGSSDEIIILDDTPSDSIKKKPTDKKRSRTDDDDEVIVLDCKPDNWVDKPLRKKRRTG
ncbi:hypothetical protein C8R48DRAFT_782699 [Suillus tomentosus]|nr:hypothetical protein C8R48DRAFT_782699 [Suillus tomentosus]